jgi:hypothetical protein
MRKIALGGLTLLVMTVSAFTLRNQTGTQSISNAHLATNAAFRDGLFLGEFAKKNGTTYHAATTRWARVADRESFAAGYEQGYRMIAAPRAAK